MDLNQAREQFLTRVREAVSQGNQAGGSPSLPDRGLTGYQGGGSDIFGRLEEELRASGGHFHTAIDDSQAVTIVHQILAEKAPCKVLLGGNVNLPDLGKQLEGVETQSLSEISSDHIRGELFAADVGITAVDFVIAETGTIVLKTGPDQPRSLSLLVPVHIAIARQKQVLPDLFDLFGYMPYIPSCLSLITGPSKTGDIELKLVTGVHGPGEVHLVLITNGGQ